MRSAQADIPHLQRLVRGCAALFLVGDMAVALGPAHEATPQVNSEEYCRKGATECEKNCKSGDAKKEGECQADCSKRFKECLTK